MENMTINQSGLKCDNPTCSWEDKTIPFENYERYINAPCPLCGENILTCEDYDNAVMLHQMVEDINKLSTEELANLAAAAGITSDGPASERLLEISVDLHKGINVESVSQHVLEKEWPGSSNVNLTKYHPTAEVLEVSFKSGTYKYLAVPKSVWLQLIAAESVGSFIAKNIKGKYEAVKL